MSGHITQKEAQQHAGSLARLRASAKEQASKVTRTGAGVGSAFAVAYLEGRRGEDSKVLGMDLSLLIGVGATVAGMYGVADKATNELLESAGAGALCVYASNRGRDMGARAKAEAATK